MSRPTSLTGVERTFGEDELIVSKTDVRGHITYANRLFISLAGYTEQELIGAPHCIVRHPEMPRAIFSLLWTHLKAGKEIFAYVVNRSKNGDHYWVFAHVTPTFDAHGQIVGFHSNRRKADPTVLARIQPLYRQLLSAESAFQNPKDQVVASKALLDEILAKRGMGYDEYMFAA